MSDPVGNIAFTIAAVALGIAAADLDRRLRSLTQFLWVRWVSLSVVTAWYAALVGWFAGAVSFWVLGLGAAVWLALAVISDRLVQRYGYASRRRQFYMEFHRIAQELKEKASTDVDHAAALQHAGALETYRDGETHELIDLVQAEVRDWVGGRSDPAEVAASRRARIREIGDRLFLVDRGP